MVYISRNLKKFHSSLQTFNLHSLLTTGILRTHNVTSSQMGVTRKHWPPVRRPPYGPPQKIAEKENKQKWQKHLTYHLNGLTARVGEYSNVYFRKINRLGRKVILIAYFAVAMYESPRKTCVLWRSRISFAYCFASPILFGSVSCVRDHELDPGITKKNTTCRLSRVSHGSVEGSTDRGSVFSGHPSDGFIAQSVEHCNCLAEVMGSNPVHDKIFFKAVKRSSVPMLIIFNG